MRLNIVLALLLLASALGLVTSQHTARKAFIELERSQAQARQIETQWDQLEVEHSQWTKSSLIDTKARRDLKMQPQDPSRTLHFTMSPERAAITAKVQPDLQVPLQPRKTTEPPVKGPR